MNADIQHVCLQNRALSDRINVYLRFIPGSFWIFDTTADHHSRAHFEIDGFVHLTTIKGRGINQKGYYDHKSYETGKGGDRLGRG